MVLTGCSAPESEAPPTSAPPTPVSLPDTMVGNQAQWVIDTMNAAPAPEVSEAEVKATEERFAQLMLDEVSAADLSALFNGLRDQRTWVPTAVKEFDDSMIVTLHGTSGEPVDMSIAVDSVGKIQYLFFGPVAADRKAATSWDELESALQDSTADISMAVTEVDGGGNTNVFSHNGDDVMPLGSIFKLYVLGAVATAVANGTLTWETPVTITDDIRSLPSGVLQDAANGTQVTVQQAAEKMISISDNTATDALFALVGRDAVEQQLTSMGNKNASLDLPFLNTRELFTLGWGSDPAVRTQWRDADEAGRRAMLAALPTGDLGMDGSEITDSVWQYGLDWFATSGDLVAAHTALQALADTDAGAPIRDILSLNPGTGMTIGEEWTYVGFKGGSAPGVLAGSWYVEGENGKHYVLSIQGSSTSPDELNDALTFFGNVEDALAILAKS